MLHPSDQICWQCLKDHSSVRSIGYQDIHPATPVSMFSMARVIFPVGNPKPLIPRREDFDADMFAGNQVINDFGYIQFFFKFFGILL